METGGQPCHKMELRVGRVLGQAFPRRGPQLDLGGAPWPQHLPCVPLLGSRSVAGSPASNRCLGALGVQ